MGSGHVADVDEASLAVEFADPNREQALGTRIEWSAEFCHMPDAKEIPTLDDRPAPIRLPGGHVFQVPDLSSMSLHDRLNSRYYHQLASFTFFRRLVRKIRLVVTNTGEVPATDVRLEISILNGQGFGILDWSDVPDAPKRRESFFTASATKNLRIRPAFRHAGDVDIDKNDEQTKVEIDCGSLQPGRKVWTDAFFMGIGQSGEVKLTGHLFAANLPQPQEFTLSINAAITETTMTVDELLVSDEPSDDDDE